MNETVYLTLKEQMSAARVFLNTFGLILDEPEEIDVYAFKINILNQNNKETGMLYFEDGKVKIQADTPFGKLKSEYNLATYSGFRDIECGGSFIEWRTNINFNIFLNKEFNLDGEMQIDCSMDTTFGNKCRTHTLLKYNENENNITINFMRDGCIFSYKMESENEKEIINVSPCDIWGDYIKHYYHKGKYDENKYGYPYKKVSGVRNHHKNDNSLEVYSFVEKYVYPVSYTEKFIKREGKDESAESVIQKGLLMQLYEKDYTKKLEEIRNKFTNDDISLIDNLMDVSLASYSDEEVKALFGTDRHKVNYQNGANNLIDAYYGVVDNNRFLSKESQDMILKRILK